MKDAADMVPLASVLECMAFRIGFVILLAGTSLLAADFDRILIPLFESVPRPGAFGSLWGTELLIRNNSEEQIPLIPPTCNPPTPARFCTTPTILSQYSTTHVAGFYGVSTGPLMLNVPRGTGERILASLRVINLSRTAEQFGTSIPIVREKDLKTGIAQILDVPNSDGLRSSLRIFDFDSRDASSFAVRVYDLESDELISAATLQTAGVPPGRPPGVEIVQPGYVNVSVADLVASAPNRKLRIEVEGRDGVRFWTFVSVTANETQFVTVLLPQ
jgi:hypothetical protein